MPWRFLSTEFSLLSIRPLVHSECRLSTELAQSVILKILNKPPRTGLTYQPFGGASGWTYGNGLVRGNDFDLDGRLTGISTTMPSNTAVLQSLTYGLDD